MTSVANDNPIPAAPGGMFYPEMGEKHDGKALFVASIGHGGYYITWAVDRHDEALAAFKLHRIRPRHMECYETTRGGRQWSAGLTWEAGRKLVDGKAAVIKALLD